MSEHPGFCPACFAPLAQEADTCPACGARMADLSARDYREKLVHALLHPLADVRMRAIIALGLRGEPETADALVKCAMNHPTDVVQGLEIIRSLARMKETEAARTALSLLQARHPAHAVREAAGRKLECSTLE
ncbi:MAG: HEAT repeat domain-containing protein [Sulfuricella sp.]|nr:HEAT repeat domain-containing protein [Sulfuricella sp.]